KCRPTTPPIHAALDCVWYWSRQHMHARLLEGSAGAKHMEITGQQYFHSFCGGEGVPNVFGVFNGVYRAVFNQHRVLRDAMALQESGHCRCYSRIAPSADYNGPKMAAF